MTPDGIRQLVQKPAQIRNSDEYAGAMRVCPKNTEEVKESKRKRDNACLAAKRERREFGRAPRSRQGALWASGELGKQMLEADAAYGNRQRTVVAVLLQR